MEPDLAAVGPLQQVDAPHQCALSGAGQADNAEDFSLPDGQAHILQCLHLIVAGAEGFAEMIQFKQILQKSSLLSNQTIITTGRAGGMH